MNCVIKLGVMMAIGYRAVFNLQDNVDAIRVARSQFHSWVKDKVRDFPGGSPHHNIDLPGVHQFGDRFEVYNTETCDEKSGVRRAAHRLKERNSDGVWEVAVYSFSSQTRRNGQSQTIVVEAALAESTVDEAVARMAIPRVVRNILDETAAHDGYASISTFPTLVRSEDVENLLNSITDVERMAPLVVASAVDLESEDGWTKLVQSLTSESLGNVSVNVVLTGAVDELNNRLPSSHRVRAGEVRTFMPAVQLDDEADGLRHRFVGPRTLARNYEQGSRKISRALRKAHAENLRRMYIDRPLPKQLSRDLRLVREDERKMVEDFKLRSGMGLADEPRQVTQDLQFTEMQGFPTLEESEQLLALTEEPQDSTEMQIDTAGFTPADSVLLQDQSLLIDILRQEREDAIGWAEELDSELNEAKQQIEDGAVELRLVLDEYDDARSRLDAAERELAYLKRQTKSRVGSAGLEVDLDEWGPIPDMAELLEILDPPEPGAHLLHKRISFTGDYAVAAKIDLRDHLGKHAQQIFDFIHVLFDYAEAKANGFQGSFYMYLTSDGEVLGRKCSPKRYAAQESDTAVNQYGHERVFNVPTSVDPAGKIMMREHFKLYGAGNKAPRVYFYDDTQESGRIYIGYIGPHLNNAGSN